MNSPWMADVLKDSNVISMTSDSHDVMGLAANLGKAKS